jgi:hypothetical protein
MERETPEYTLYLQMRPQDVLDFLTRTEHLLVNAVWHLCAPYELAQMHHVFCELRHDDIVQTRAAIVAAVGVEGGIGKKWHLLMTRVSEIASPQY